MASLPADQVGVWLASPLAFIEDCFAVTPDPWQRRVIEAFNANPMQAIQSCKGPGKTATLAWLGLYMLATRPLCKGVALSVTSDNLRDNLWAEFAKWLHRSKLLCSLFEWQKERIIAREAPEQWFISARAYAKDADPQRQADTLAGLHADYVFILIDEAGGVPPSVLVAAEAIRSSAKEAHIVLAGNPTDLNSALYLATVKAAHRYHVTRISADPADPNRSTRIDPDWAADQIERYGRDNPWVQVNVFGAFPPSSLNTLIGLEEVEAAMNRHARPEQYLPFAKILGVDVARYGDDASVIFPRQGPVAFTPLMLRNADSLQGAATVAHKWTEWDADACQIDATGGHGSGWIDQLRALGFTPIGVQFAGKANDPRFANKRIEMWMNAVAWIRAGGVLPRIPELAAELTTPTYTFRGDKMFLEDKEQVKARLGRSPDYADALACTFAYPVTSARQRSIFDSEPLQRATALIEYDPFEDRTRPWLNRASTN